MHWETAVLGAHHLLDRTPVMNPDDAYNEEWTIRHRHFHSVLLSGCGNIHIEAAAKVLRDSAELSTGDGIGRSPTTISVTFLVSTGN